MSKIYIAGPFSKPRTKKSLKDLNTVFKSISGINSIEIGEWAE